MGKSKGEMEKVPALSNMRTRVFRSSSLLTLILFQFWNVTDGLRMVSDFEF